MQFVSEKAQSGRLRRLGVSIQTDFWENHQIRTRTSDHTEDEDVNNGIIIQKRYYKDGRLDRTEKDFSPLMMYTYLGGDVLEGSLTCPNCGYRGEKELFTNGCPYCGTVYNVEYAGREEGCQFFADRNVKNPWLYAKAFLICLAVCLPFSFFIVRSTGRTFFFFDKLKALLFGFLPALLLSYIYYVGNAFVITRRAEEKYEKQTELIRWFQKKMKELGIPVSTFYNNLLSELAHLFYTDTEDGAKTVMPEDADRQAVIDMDVLEYRDFSIRDGKQGQPDISVSVNLRKVFLKRDRIHSKEETFSVTMRENRIVQDELHPGVNVICCRNCGASIDVTREKCDFCGTRINYLQRLYITDFKRI